MLLYHPFFTKRSSFALVLSIGLCYPAVAQPQMVTKHLSDFDTLGAGFPNDQINDHLAFLKAAAFFNARGGYGTLIIDDGEYIIGLQQLHTYGTPLPGPDWHAYGYPAQNANQCKSMVARKDGFTLTQCAQFTLQGGSSTTIRYRDCLYYGTFFRDQLSNQVSSALTTNNCVKCGHDSLLAWEPNLLHADVGTMFTFIQCDSIIVRDLELNGNLDHAILGGRGNFDGNQTEYSGVTFYECANSLIENINSHHFGLDGCTIMGRNDPWSTVLQFDTIYPNLDTDTTSDPGTIVFHNKVLGSHFDWNGRQGISWTRCAGLTVSDCSMNFNGAGRDWSSPGAGIDIEGTGGPTRLRHGVFNNCEFLHNRGAGVHSDIGPCLGQQDFVFNNCVLKAGEDADALWPDTRGMKFNDCQIYGRVFHLFEQAEDVQIDPDGNLEFRRTDFSEEDGEWSYMFVDTTSWSTIGNHGPSKLDLVASNDQAASVAFDSCNFYTNCWGMLRLLGRGHDDTHFPYCTITCDSCGIQGNHCPLGSCGSGPYLHFDTDPAPDSRYMRATDCYFRNTGRKRVADTTILILVDLTTLENFRIDVPNAVRNSSDPNDVYQTRFGLTPWAQNCVLSGYCADVDTIYSTYESFPPCQPFYHWPDSIVRWNHNCPSANIPVQACLSDANCYSDQVIADGTLSSSMSGPISGTVFIEGLFIVDADFTFDNAEVRMNAGAEIVVQPGATLLIENSVVHSCQGVMWKSMTVSGGGVLKIRQSFIDDGEDAVKAMDGSSIVLDGNQFRNNRVAVQVPQQSTAPVYAVSLYVVNNTFYSSGTMPMPYPGQASAVGAQGYAAFDIDRINLDLTAAPNLIHSLSNGIVAYQCDLNITQATFLHIQPDSAYLHYANGSAIYARGPKSWHNLYQSGFGTDPVAAPSFEDCYWGIYTEYMNVYSTANFMLDVGTAYRIDRSGYMDVDIVENRLDTRRDGIVLVMNDGAAHLLVEHNDITFAQNLPPNQYTKGYYAIRVYEANTLNNDSKIQNNTIRYRQGASTAYGGIGLVSANKYLVANNYMRMTDNASNRVGVMLNGCKAPDVRCNEVRGANNGFPELAQAGIRNWMGEWPVIACNTLDSVTNGMLFSGYALNVDLKGNEFNWHRWGLHLEYGAQIGTQDLKGNMWYQASPGNGWQAWHENATSASFQIITYDGLIPNTLPPQREPPNWFQPASGPTFTCNGAIGECDGYKARCKDCPNALYDQVADGTVENGNYTDETRWTFEGDLYATLKDAPLLLDDPELQVFYSEVQASVAGQLDDLDDSRLALFDMDSTILGQLHLNREQLVILQAELKLALEQMATPDLTEAQKSALQGAISGLQQTMSELIAYNTAALELAANTRVLSAEEVKNSNAAIGATALTEANYKTVNEIYLNTVAKDVEGFTAQQAQDLFEVSNQCPLTGGNAVFWARALYYLIDPELDFDDPTLCLQEGLITKHLIPEGLISISVVPNPATNQATLILSHPLSEDGVLIIRNATGAVVLSLRLLEDQQQLPFSTASLVPGLYQFQASTFKGPLGEGRLCIIR